MKKQLLLLAIMLLPMMASGYDFSIDGIYYSIRTYGEGNNVLVDKGDEYYEGEIVIPSSVVYNDIEYQVIGINYNAFKDNTRLKKVTIPESIESLSSTFWGCSGLTEVILPNSLKSIDSYAFYSCSSLESINLPNQLETIGASAFSDCVSLKEIIIPQSVININGSIFQSCPSLSSIQVEEGNLKYDSRDNCNAIIDKETLCLISGCKNTIIPAVIKSIAGLAFNGCTKLQSISIPESVIDIGYAAFAGCTSLNSIKLPSGITTIEEQLFRDCSSLKQVELPSGLKKIGNYAFINCTALTSFIIPKTVTEIGTYAFAYTPLQSITIPEGITELESDIFKECHNLNKVFLPSTLKKIGNETFWRCYSLYDVWCYAPVAPYTTNSSFESAPYQYATLHIYKSALDDYKVTWPWSDFAVYEFIKEGDKEQCAKPTISCNNGKLIFSCDTEGVEYHWNISSPNTALGTGSEVTFEPTVIVSVYASKDGYDDSDTTTMEIKGVSSHGDANGDGEVNITDVTYVIDIINQQ